MVMSSMQVRMGGSQCPDCRHSPPMTHLEARMITSIAMVKAWGEMVHPAIIPTSNDCHDVVYSVVVEDVQNCRSWKEVVSDQVCDGRWHMEKLEGCPEERKGD